MSAPKAYSTLENQYDKHESKDGMKNYSVKKYRAFVTVRNNLHSWYASAITAALPRSSYCKLPIPVHGQQKYRSTAGRLAHLLPSGKLVHYCFHSSYW
jgi:hypothetical protein